MGERIDLARHYLTALRGATVSWAKIGETFVRHAAREVPLRVNVDKTLAATEKLGLAPSPLQDNFIRRTDPMVASYTKEAADRNPTRSLAVGYVRIRRGLELLAENDGEMKQATVDAVHATVKLLSLAPEVAITFILGPKTES